MTIQSKHEEGEATIEFIAVTFIFVIPLLYLIITMASVQASVFAAESSSREGVRILTNNVESADLAREQVGLVFDDFHLSPPDSVEIRCIPHECAGKNAIVSVSVHTHVDIPLVPGFAPSLHLIPVNVTSEGPVGDVTLVANETD